MIEIFILILCAIPLLLIYLNYQWEKRDAEAGNPGPPKKFFFGNLLDVYKAVERDGDCK